MWAEAFADAQENRIAFENRDRSGTVELEAFGAVLALFAEAEERLRKEMIACYQVTVPQGIRDWQQATAGIGESTLARLLGIVGDPRTAYPKHWEGSGNASDGQAGRHLVQDPPHERTIGQLWQYCGHGRVKNREVKGDAAALMANGQPDAKKLVYLMAAAQVKTNAKGGSGYRHVYDETKAKYAEQVHLSECKGGFSGALYVKCKTHPAGSPGGKPGYAQAGDPFQKSHVHTMALRYVGKEILKALWLACGPVPPHLDHKFHYHSGQAARLNRPERKAVTVPGSQPGE
jgi:hypothetical protein